MNFAFFLSLLLSLAFRSATDTTVYAWQGERLGLEAYLTSPEARRDVVVRVKGPRALRRATQVSTLAPVTTTWWRTCGYPSPDLPTFRVYDRIDPLAPLTLAAGDTARLWLTIEVPRTLRPATYNLAVAPDEENAGAARVRLVVLPRRLPRPEAQTFHLDLWQQPYSLCRYYGVEPWSPQHLDILRPYLQLLGRAGQKVITAILFYEPWGEQSRDKFLPMIATTLRRDGTWAYDYTAFDRYIALCRACGIGPQINCYSMVPWDMTFRYYDEARGENVDLHTTTSSPEYADLWTHFLQAFAAHLRAKGWYDQTLIAMDERGLDAMRDAYRVAQAAVPGIKMALAGNYHEELAPILADYSIPFGRTFPKETANATHTFYTCCTEPYPNIFSNNRPSDAFFLPLHAAARGLDGYLHWSWLNWTDDPLFDTRFRMFAPGDTYCVYPGPRSSRRFERLIEGIEAYEKVRLLREEYTEAGDTLALRRLREALKAFAVRPTSDGQTEALRQNVQRLLGEL